MKLEHLEILIVTKEAVSFNRSVFPFREVFQCCQPGEFRLRPKVAKSSYQEYGQNPSFSSLQITSYPTVLFIDTDRQKTLVRLEGTAITSRNVYAVLKFLEQLKVNQLGEYTYKGKPFPLNMRVIKGEDLKMGIPKPVNIGPSKSFSAAGLLLLFLAITTAID